MPAAPQQAAKEPDGIQREYPKMPQHVAQTSPERDELPPEIALHPEPLTLNHK